MKGPSRRLAHRQHTRPVTKALTTKQTIGITLAGLLGVCCCGSGLAGAFGDNNDTKPVSAPTASATVEARKLGDALATVTPTPDDTPTPTPSPTPKKTNKPKPAPYYKNCDAVRAAGDAPLFEGEPGYRPGLDRDGDGEACEPGGGNGDLGGYDDTNGDVYYANCTAVRAAGAAPIRRGDPGYSRKLDRDGDGIACE
ncbi:excalibur calcium-binding domain-containing protein [Micromonospora sp. MMS20-R2-29]|uniref:Excalibur calcium-binding domain-containing protein n=1 Tax=Micromonospora humidisoli TaxID=2807622 RepID=A0ABS2JL36_9ACTN|nr:excalibur calcium-binding domain-containing protein [Micromonospora humidisoli]